MKKFNHIFFDLFDTIVYVDEDIYYEGKKEAAELANVDFESFIEAWRSTSEDAIVGKLKDPFKRASETLKKLGIEDRNICAKVALNDVETIQKCVFFYDGATETLSFLREKGYTLSLLSNATATTAFILQALHLRDRFDHLILSYEIGFKKPDKKFFEIALSRSGALPDETLFVGDGANRELDAAREMGITTLRLEHKKKALTFMNKETLSSDDHNTIFSFSELIKYLGY